MASARIFYSNLVDSADAISASTEETDFNVEHVSVPFRQVKWRSTADSDENITIDLGTATAATGAVIIDHNFTASGTFTIRASTDNFGASNDLIATFTHNSGIMVVTWGSTSYRYWRLRMEDATNPDTYVEVGRWFLTEFFEPVTNYEYPGGRVEGLIDTSIIQQSLNSVTNSVVRPLLRTEGLRFPVFTEAERDNWIALRDAVGTNESFVLQVDPDDNPNTDTLYCRMQQPITIPHTFDKTFTVNMQVVEQA